MDSTQNQYIGNILCNLGFTTHESMDTILLRMTTTKESFIQLLINEGISFERISLVIKEYFHIDYLDITNDIIDKDVLDTITHSIAIKYDALPIQKINKKLVVAMENPFDTKAIDDIELITGFRVISVLAKKNQIKYFINHYYGTSNINAIESQFLIDENLKKEIYILDDTLKEDIQNAPAVKLIDSLLESAILLNASDIHIEPYEKIIRTRYRIDGHLKEFQSVDIALLSNIISRLKIMGTLDISEKRIPQDGHFKLNINHTNIDFRLSTMPTIFGEKAVIRMIYSHGAISSKDSLGFFKEDIEKINMILKNPYGAILVTGPTGSGKTTTIGSFLNELNNEEVNIITIEDPVENIIHGLNQININTKISLDFSNILRSILRQDPDIIMIGEIRDKETARIAVQAAITGHLVLSTLHTNDAISTIVRLIDMGVEDYLLTTAIKCVISQRLVRRLCDHCKEVCRINKHDAKVLKISDETKTYEARGCDKCNNTGYKGRFAVYELVLMDDILQALIERKASQEEIKKELIKKGLMTIWDCALQNVLLGNTSISEMYRTIFIF